MSYCRPRWISDYHFSNALRFRLFVEEDFEREVAAARPSLLVWGSQNSDDEIVLNPSFLVHAPPALPESHGEFEIRGRRESGDELFSLSFDMQEVADGEGNRSFVFVVPIQSDWQRDLNVVTLQGPKGAQAVDLDNADSMSLVRNPITQQIRGIHSIPREDAAARIRTIDEASQRGFEVLFNRGSPEAAVWSP